MEKYIMKNGTYIVKRCPDGSYHAKKLLAEFKDKTGDDVLLTKHLCFGTYAECRKMIETLGRA